MTGALPSSFRMRQSSAYGTRMVGLRAVVEKTAGHQESQLMRVQVCDMAATWTATGVSSTNSSAPQIRERETLPGPFEDISPVSNCSLANTYCAVPSTREYWLL